VRIVEIYEINIRRLNGSFSLYSRYYFTLFLTERPSSRPNRCAVGEAAISDARQWTRNDDNGVGRARVYSVIVEIVLFFAKQYRRTFMLLDVSVLPRQSGRTTIWLNDNVQRLKTVEKKYKNSARLIDAKSTRLSNVPVTTKRYVSIFC